MYTIKFGDKLIYAPTLDAENYDVLDPSITQELNLADKLTFSIPTKNPNYDAITTMKPEIKVYDNAKRIFRGRVIGIGQNYDKTKTISAEGELGYLNDAVVRHYDYSGTVKGYFTMLINAYNAQVDQWKRFVVGDCDVLDADGNDYIVRGNIDYPTVFAEIKNKLLDNLGGYLKPRCEVVDGVEINYIDYLKDSGDVGEQVIRFAQNLLDINTDVNVDDIYTVVIPLGAKTGEEEDAPRLGIADVTGKNPDDPTAPWGKDYIANADGVDRYGRIERVVVWDDVTVATNLWNKGYAAVSKASSVEQSVELQALDMHDLGDDVDALTLGWRYRLISVPHGYQNDGDKNLFRLSRIIRLLQSPDRSTFTFGRVAPMLTRL